MIIFLSGLSRKSFILRSPETPERIGRFVHSYVEASTMIGLGVRMVLVVVKGAWPFHHKGSPGKEKRCLISEGDGTGNDELYEACTAQLPPTPSDFSETVVSLISENSINDVMVEDVEKSAMLCACFDIASWFVDSMPHSSIPSGPGLSPHENLAFVLGAYAATLSMGLYHHGLTLEPDLMRMELAIIGITIEKIAASWSSRNGLSGACQDDQIRSYERANPGMCDRIADAIRGVSLDQSLTYFKEPEKILHQGLHTATRILLSYAS